MIILAINKTNKNINIVYKINVVIGKKVRITL